MIDFSSISRRSRTLGRILRLPLDMIPKGTVVPILQGKLRGRRWIVGANLHACWLGSYEMDKQQFFHSHLQPGSIVFDVGANVGFYTLLSSVIVGETGHIFAFEPLPRNLDLLQKHLTLNKLENVTVLPLAIADRVGTAQFEQGPRHTWGRIGDHGDINVKISTLDFLLELQQVKIPDFIKIDVEGAEVDVLRGGENLLRSYSPVIILETHGEELYTECVSLLKQYGYEVHDFVAATQEREIFAVKK